MDSSTEGQKARDPLQIVQAVIIVAIVLSAALIVYIFYSNSQEAKAAAGAAVASGDAVTLNYIGRLADGRVFDTSIYSVASDDVVYPKSLTFTLRSNDTYEPFDMTAGNYGSGGTIKGFALGVIGMRVNETRIVEVAPEDGYAVDPNAMVQNNLVEVITATETMTASEFTSSFGTDAKLLLVVPHPFWGWDVMVTDNSSSMVTVKHIPTVNHTYYPYGDPEDPDDPMGWPVIVESYDPSALGGEGSITIRNMIDSSDVYNIKGVDSEGYTFILWSLDSTNSTFVTHRSSSSGYNGELAGRALFFEITIVKVVPAED